MDLLRHRNSIGYTSAWQRRSGRAACSLRATPRTSTIRRRLGLNCGIHDALELAETLHLVASGRPVKDLLDRYEAPAPSAQHRIRATTDRREQEAAEERDRGKTSEFSTSCGALRRIRSSTSSSSCAPRLIESVRKAGKIG